MFNLWVGVYFSKIISLPICYSVSISFSIYDASNECKCCSWIQISKFLYAAEFCSCRWKKVYLILGVSILKRKSVIWGRRCLLIKIKFSPIFWIISYNAYLTPMFSLHFLQCSTQLFCMIMFQLMCFYKMLYRKD